VLCAKTYKRLLTLGALPRRIEFTSRSVPWYDVVIDVDVPIGIGNRMPNSREQFAPMLQPETDGVFGIVGELGCTLKDGIRYGWVSRVVNTERFPVPASSGQFRLRSGRQRSIRPRASLRQNVPQELAAHCVLQCSRSKCSSTEGV
jgi:hypothetical protein